MNTPTADLYGPSRKFTMNSHHAGIITHGIAKLLYRLVGVRADEHQQNAMYGAHQLRVRLPNDPTEYRAIVAPANAPISIGTDHASIRELGSCLEAANDALARLAAGESFAEVCPYGISRLLNMAEKARRSALDGVPADQHFGYPLGRMPADEEIA